MKKLVLFALLLSASGASLAQENAIRVGLKAGLNLSNYLGKTHETNDWKNQKGLNGGLVLNIPISTSVFSLQPELLYSMKGAVYYAGFPKGPEFEKHYTTRQNYLELPIMAHFKTKWVYFEFGPVASALLNAELEIEPEMRYYLGESRSTTKEYRSWNIGGAIGAGAVIGNNARLGVRYVADFTALPTTDKNAMGTIAWREGFYNSVIQISGIWLFGGKSENE